MQDDPHHLNNPVIKPVSDLSDLNDQNNASALYQTDWGSKDEVEEFLRDQLDPDITSDFDAPNQNPAYQPRLRYRRVNNSNDPGDRGQVDYSDDRRSYALSLKKTSEGFAMTCPSSQHTNDVSERLALQAMIHLLGKLMEKSGGVRRLVLTGNANAINIMKQACNNAQPRIEYEEVKPQKTSTSNTGAPAANQNSPDETDSDDSHQSQPSSLRFNQN